MEGLQKADSDFSAVNRVGHSIYDYSNEVGERSPLHDGTFWDLLHQFLDYVLIRILLSNQ